MLRTLSFILCLMMPMTALAFAQAPVYESDSEAFRHDAGNISVPAPVGVVDDDVLLSLTGKQDDTGTFSGPAGFSVQLSFDGGVGVAGLHSATKVAASESGTYDVAVGADGGVSVVARLSGVDTAAPVNVDSAEATGSGTSISSPSVDTTVDDCLVAYVAVWRQTEAFLDSPPAGTTLQINADEDGEGPSVAIATKTQATAGSTGVGTWSLTGSAGWTAYTITFAPEASGGGGVALSFPGLELRPRVF